MMYVFYDTKIEGIGHMFRDILVIEFYVVDQIRQHMGVYASYTRCTIVSCGQTAEGMGAKLQALVWKKAWSSKSALVGSFRA